MLEKLESILQRFEELNNLLSEPDVAGDQQRFKALMKEHSGLSEVVEAIGELKLSQKNLEEARAMMSDKDLKEMAQEEAQRLETRIEELEREIQFMLLPKDINDDKNVVLEIRGGAGGDEASLFAAQLLRMYTLYGQSRGWKVEVMDLNETELGGIKEVIALVSGRGAYSRMKFESGVHRVQRVPETESQGRIHTSTVTVAIMPEAEEVDIEINPGDLRIDTYRASGAGGQHVNRTDSAVRITHLPTGIVCACQSERSQIQNREHAMKMLRTKIYDKALMEQQAATSADRKSKVGTGDRSERIRTYNFPQGRVTDHRIGLTQYTLDGFMNGDIETMLEALILEERTQMLNGGQAV